MVGESNLLARSACKALATGDATFGNCLFMNSTTGLGKSHLTQAVVHQVLHSAPSTRLHYLTAQQFSAEMVKNIRTNSMEQFSKKYVNNCDMLLVEDVHTLTGKNKTQEELNTILDYLIKSGRRVILTSALAPGKLAGIDDDFRSRMTSGLVTGIESPDYETRARIIRHKMRQHGLGRDEDLVGFMAENLRGDIRRMESAILGIKAKSSLRNTPPDLAMVREVIFGLIGDSAGDNRRIHPRSHRQSVPGQCRRSPVSVTQTGHLLPPSGGHVPHPQIHRQIPGRHRQHLQPRPFHGPPRHQDHHQRHVPPDFGTGTGGAALHQA